MPPPDFVPTENGVGVPLGPDNDDDWSSSDEDINTNAITDDDDEADLVDNMERFHAVRTLPDLPAPVTVTPPANFFFSTSSPESYSFMYMTNDEDDTTPAYSTPFYTTTTPAPTVTTTERPTPSVSVTPSPRPVVVHAGTPTSVTARLRTFTTDDDNSINEVTDSHFLPTVTPSAKYESFKKKSKAYYPTKQPYASSRRPYTYVRELKTVPLSYFRGKSVEWGDDSFPSPSAAVEELSAPPPPPLSPSNRSQRREDRARWVNAGRADRNEQHVTAGNAYQRR